MSAESFLKQEETDIYDANCSIVWAFDENGMMRELLRESDVYEALFKVRHKTFEPDELGIVVTTCGWAAPIEEDTVPSEHPKRQRCFMATAVSRAFEQANTIRMKDNPDASFEDMDGSGTGPFADAVTQAVMFMTLKTLATEIAWGQ
jgi:hypothetical protein